MSSPAAVSVHAATAGDTKMTIRVIHPIERLRKFLNALVVA
ncbi:MAG: hypothetical protein ACXWCX_02650 [Burkholderiales bacterium]